MDELLTEFIAETEEGLRDLDTDLLQLDQGTHDADLLTRMFRVLHTLKGNCGFVRLPHLEALAHDAETFLIHLRDPSVTITPDLVGQLAEQIDEIHSLFGHIKTYQAEPANDTGEPRDLTLGSLLTRLQCAIDDLSERFEKRINLTVTGTDIQLPAEIYAAIRDPLLHLVRNAAIHGIEAVEERLRLGKPAEGMITVSASEHADRIIVSVTDNGAGLDTDRIRSIAKDKGLLPDSSLSEAELQDLIFKPGFSTAPSLTTAAGRGMGMDIVRAHVEQVGGSVEIRSERGRGTTTTMNMYIRKTLTHTP